MNNLFKTVLLPLLAILYSPYAISQSGIYMTASDFRNNNLAYANDSANGKNIRVHDFFGSMPRIKVKSNGSRYTFRKSELYGFRNNENEEYRFYHNEEYRIADTGNIWIYTQEQNIAASKGYKVINAYYFSYTADGEILRLTPGNLKAMYQTDTRFLALLTAYCCCSDVTAYDNLHHTFFVNYLYSKAMN